jgi:hypothetical protein
MVGANSQVQQRRPPKKSTQTRAHANGVEGENRKIRHRMSIHGCRQWYKPNIRKNFEGNEHITGLALADRLLFPWDSAGKHKSPTWENQTRCLLWRQRQLPMGKVEIRSHGLALAISHNPRVTSVRTVHGSPPSHIPCAQNPST